MTQKTRFKNMEDFGYGPNVMKNTKVCSKCGHVINASASYCPECDTVLAPGSLYCPNCGKQILRNAAGNEKGGG